jgi:hypothetical protein
VTRSDGGWHEPLETEAPPPSSSDRAFGLVFFAVCVVAAAAAALHGRRSVVGWSIVAVAVLAIAVFAFPVLGPLNRAWHSLALRLSKIVTPLVMGLLFFAVLTPIGIVMRWAGSNPLRLGFDRDGPSYWLDRNKPETDRPSSMTRQF